MTLDEAYEAARLAPGVREATRILVDAGLDPGVALREAAVLQGRTGPIGDVQDKDERPSA